MKILELQIQPNRWWIACGLLVVALAGCEEEIRSYQVPRLQPLEPSPPRGERTEQRLLGAIITHGDRTWFFKVVGPVQWISDQKEAVEKFIGSVRFREDRPIGWEVPAGWQQQPGSARGFVRRYATFLLGPEDRRLELTVIPLARQGVIENVNRWRDQLGLEPIDATELEECTRELELDGVRATLVDLTGMSTATANKAPFASGGARQRRE